MALTRDGGVYRCTLAIAQFVAECANLRKLAGEGGCFAPREHYHYWEDWATGGGGARIVFYLPEGKDEGYAWVSNHSGYPQADITEEVKEFFRELGATQMGDEMRYLSPQVNPGWDTWDKLDAL